jgi:hypothetical protein
MRSQILHDIRSSHKTHRAREKFEEVLALDPSVAPRRTLFGNGAVLSW